MGERICRKSGAAANEESIVSGSQLALDRSLEQLHTSELPVEARPIRVLTLTPFYPSAQDTTRGSFISAPLASLQKFHIVNQTLAVQPFYREAAYQAVDESARRVRYFSFPTNLGLASAGEFLATSIVRAVPEMHGHSPFDLIHAHAALPCGHAAALLSRRWSIPFAVSAHGLDVFFDNQAGQVLGKWCGRVAEHVYQSAGVVICISEKVREQVASRVRANTAVIYNGVDAELFSPDIEPTGLTVLSVGNLIETKGHASLIRAFAQILKAIPECMLEIIGDGPEHKKLIRLAGDLKVSHKVHFHGRQQPEAVAKAMRRCSVFALPSWYEGFGCVYLEAMACAKPVIGCDGQGIDEVIEHGKTGMLVPTQDAEKLSDVLSVLLRNSDLRGRIGASARKLVLQSFTVQHQAQQLAEVYRRVAA